MTIALAVFGYAAAAGLFIRFLQFAHSRDAAMQKITAEWIEETSGATS